MKKYKLIKKYPGSPELGTEVEQHNINNSIIYLESNKLSIKPFPKCHIENNEFWQEIVEKDYEILSYLGICGTICKLQSNGKYLHSNDNHIVNYENYKIHSVKRLSDDEVFTIGDDILEQKEHSKIDYFELRSNEIVLRINHQVTKGSSTILLSSKFEKYIPKKPLFTTEDNVKIFESSDYWFIHTDYNSGIADLKPFEIIKAFDISMLDLNNKYIKRFSTKEAAKDYIIMNKPCLSLDDFIKDYRHITGKNMLIDGPFYNRIKKLVKSKLNL